MNGDFLCHFVTLGWFLQHGFGNHFARSFLLSCSVGERIAFCKSTLKAKYLVQLRTKCRSQTQVDFFLSRVTSYFAEFHEVLYINLLYNWRFSNNNSELQGPFQNLFLHFERIVCQINKLTFPRNRPLLYWTPVVGSLT